MEPENKLTTENAYVARQTIVSVDRDTVAYELLFRDGWENRYPDISPDEATSRLITNAQLEQGIDQLVGEHRAFINFTEQSLLNGFPRLFDKDKIVVEILETVTPSEEILAVCSELKAQGYRLALDDYDFHEKWQVFDDLVDIIKVDIEGVDDDMLSRKLQTIRTDDVELLAERVETHEQFEFCKKMGFSYFQGYFFSKPEVVEKKKLPSNKIVMLQLLAETTREPVDFKKISTMISRDVGLAFKLLKFINSPACGVANNITSLPHALSYIGENELRKFTALMAMAAIGEDKPVALLSLAAVRARFCEHLMLQLGKPDKAGTAFLCGLFSLIEAVMNESLESIFRKLPIDVEIKDALRGRENFEGNLLKLVLAFEQGDWARATALSDMLQIEERILGSGYREAINWSRQLEAFLV